MVGSLLAFLQTSPLGVALAQAAPPSGGAQKPGGIAGILAGPIPLMAMMVLLFYFMLWRPQSKKQKETQEMLRALKVGDEVVTSGGLIGKITGITDSVVTLQVQEKVRLKVVRSHVTGLHHSMSTAAGGVAPKTAAAPESK